MMAHTRLLPLDFIGHDVDSFAQIIIQSESIWAEQHAPFSQLLLQLKLFLLACQVPSHFLCPYASHTLPFTVTWILRCAPNDKRAYNYSVVPLFSLIESNSGCSVRFGWLGPA